MDGINATRRYIDRCWFDKDKCKRGLETLTQYRREYDEKLRSFRVSPLHDWTSHGADAFRTRAAIASNDLAAPRDRYRGKTQSSTSWMSA
jgi:hypothetical protein